MKQVNHNAVTWVQMALIAFLIGVGPIASRAEESVDPAAGPSDDFGGTITFCGREWMVRAGKSDPGSNVWTTSCVWLDTNNWLHIQLKKFSQTWYSGQAETRVSLGYGEYRWQLVGRPDLIDSNTVIGLFTFESTTNEIDIEFARAFSPGGRTNFYCTIQPWNIASHQYRTTLSFTNEQTTHRFIWHPQYIQWQSWYGYAANPPATPLAQWAFQGYEVPVDSNEKVMMNVWSYYKPPADTNHIEVVIRDFTYVPYTLGASIEPKGAFEAGARWRINGGEWITGGRAFPYSTGIYTLECDRVAGWIEPEPQVITQTPGATNIVRLTYTKIPSPPDPLKIQAIALTNSVTLSWNNPRLSGFSNRTVLVRFATNTYPEALTDGAGLYTGTAQRITHSSLTPGKTYYYTVWPSHDGIQFVNP